MRYRKVSDEKIDHKKGAVRTSLYGSGASKSVFFLEAPHSGTVKLTSKYRYCKTMQLILTFKAGNTLRRRLIWVIETDDRSKILLTGKQRFVLTVSITFPFCLLVLSHPPTYTPSIHMVPLSSLSLHHHFHRKTVASADRDDNGATPPAPSDCPRSSVTLLP